MTKKIDSPEAVLTLQDMEALKTLADPLRSQIMEVLTPKPLTVNQVAAKLGVSSSKLYYHFNLLEKHGFLRIVDTTIHGNLIEKHYWITAYQFKIDEEMFNFNVDTPEGTEQIISVLLANLNATREDLERSMYARHAQISQGAQPTPRSVLNMREIFALPDDKAEIFHRRLHELVQEFMQEAEALGEQEGEVLPWALSLLFYPSFHYEDGENIFEGENNGQE